MSELRTIQVEKNKQRQQEEARKKAAYEQRRRELIKKRKRQQKIKYIASFTTIITAIILCSAYLIISLFGNKDGNKDNNENSNTGNNYTNEAQSTEHNSGTDYVPVIGFNADNYKFTDEMYKFEISDEILGLLVKAAEEKSDVQDIYKFLLENKAAYPQGLLYLACNEKAALDFIIEYPFKSKEASYYFDLSKEISENRVPRLLQWDKRWGYSAYGDDCMALDGCGPTCLSMVLIGLTGNELYNPMYVGNYCEQLGYYLDNVGTKWEFFTEGAKFFGLESMQIGNDEARMISELKKGNILICSMAPGDFTLSGHFIVIWDYKDGEFVVNDPNSITRSNKTWSYSVLEKQFKAIWTFSLKEE